MQYLANLRNKGFGAIDSMISLVLLSTILLLIVAYNQNDQRYKVSKVLSDQTDAFAVAYASYARKIISTQTEFLPTGAVTWSPNSISWPTNLAKQNIYKQIPCLTISRNNNSGGLEAIMYYVGGKAETTSQTTNIVRDAAITLGSKGGVFLNGIAIGNSGWSLAYDSPLIKGGGVCGSAPTNNSVLVNLNLLPDWREWQYLQTPVSITRGLDKASAPLQLPGRLRNFNTLKANLNIASNKGIVLNSADPNSPVKLSLQYNGTGMGTATLGLGSNSTSTIIADTIQPSSYFKAGQTCSINEVGKTVADQGVAATSSQYLARSTLVCTQNDMLCGSGSYCYLPSIANKIVFKNTNKGVQDTNGVFICPSIVPFAVANSTVITYADIYTDFKVGDSLQNLKNPAVTNYNLGSVLYTAIPIEHSLSGYMTNLGYRLNNSGTSCNTVCSLLNPILTRQWRMQGTQNPALKFQVNNGCACERNDLSSSNNLAIMQFSSPQLPSVTCSNMPVYTVN